VPLITVACHDDLSAADLAGRHLIGGRRHRWLRRPADTRGARRRHLYLDEVVEARKDTTVVLHPLADDRRVLPIERTGELVAAPGFMLVCQLQPRLPEPAEGPEAQHAPALRGADARLPGARGRSAPSCSRRRCAAGTGARLVKLAQALRRLTEHDLEETVSTRLLVMAARLVRRACRWPGACRAAAVIDALTDDADTAMPRWPSGAPPSSAGLMRPARAARCWPWQAAPTARTANACSAAAASSSSASSRCSCSPRR
jgi:nitric oxide reductase NorQ protein